MSHISARIVLYLFLALILTGCGRPAYRYLDTKDVQIEEITVRESGNFLVVDAVLRNSGSGDVNHSVYRVEFFDQDGVLLEQTSWRPLHMKGAADAFVHERSTIPGAKSYTLVISNDAS